MQEGYLPCYQIPNVPVVFENKQWGLEKDWIPKNSGDDFENKLLTLKFGMANSINTITAYIMKQLGPHAVVDLAKKPSRPFTPNHQKDIIIFCFFGLGIALATVFLIEFIDNTIKTIDEIEKYNKSVIGVIPAIGKISSQGIISRYLESKSITVLGGEKGIKRKIITKKRNRVFKKK